MKALVMVATGLCMALAGLAWAHKGASGVMKERMDFMSSLGEQTKSMAMMVRGRTVLDWSVIEQAGQRAVSIGETLPKKFPKDSFHKPSEAKTLILEEPETFASLSAALVQAGHALTAAAQRADEAAFAVAFSDYAQSCKECHSRYRE